MQMLEITNFDDRVDAKPFEIGPYGEMKLGMGADTITLIDCTAAAVMIRGDRHHSRLNLNSTLPLKGVQRYIVNPYATAIKGLYYEGLPVQISHPIEPIAGQFSTHKSFASFQPPATTGRRNGFVMMAERGDLFVRGRFGEGITASILNNASISYLQVLPEGVLSQDRRFKSQSGDVNENMHARTGTYTLGEMNDWIAATGWNRVPELITMNALDVEVFIPNGAALICHSMAGWAANMNIEVYDLGDWSGDRVT